MKITKYEDAFNYIGVKINNNIKILLHKLENVNIVDVTVNYQLIMGITEYCVRSVEIN